MRIPKIVRRFFRLEGTPPPSRPLPYSRLTLREWQSSAERVDYVAALFRDPLFRELAGMLANVRPAAPSTLDATSAAVLLGMRAGHDQLLAALLAAATAPPAPPRDVPIDYAAANVMAGWESETEA